MTKLFHDIFNAQPPTTFRSRHNHVTIFRSMHNHVITFCSRQNHRQHFVPDDSDEDLESDEEEDDIMMPKKSLVWENPINEHFKPAGRDRHNLEGFMDRYHHIRSDYAHSTLQEDLIEHLWAVKGNMQQ